MLYQQVWQVFEDGELDKEFESEADAEYRATTIRVFRPDAIVKVVGMKVPVDPAQIAIVKAKASEALREIQAFERAKFEKGTDRIRDVFSDVDGDWLDEFKVFHVE